MSPDSTVGFQLFPFTLAFLPLYSITSPLTCLTYDFLLISWSLWVFHVKHTFLKIQSCYLQIREIVEHPHLSDCCQQLLFIWNFYSIDFPNSWFTFHSAIELHFLYRFISWCASVLFGFEFFFENLNSLTADIFRCVLNALFESIFIYIILLIF